MLGICIGNTTPVKVDFLANKPLKLGQFVYIVYQEDGIDRRLLAMVEDVRRYNRYIDEAINDIFRTDLIMENSETKVLGTLQILGQVKETEDSVFLEMLKSPPPPSAKIVKPDRQILEKLFGAKNKNFVRIGKLLSEEEDIPVYIDISQVVLRHLAILAITGAGKSNTVSVLLDKIAQLNGTVAVFDFHGEYVNSKFERDGKNVVNVIKPVFDPTKLPERDFANLIGIKPNATVQYRYFKRALKELLCSYSDSKGEDWRGWVNTVEFFSELIKILELWAEDPQDSPFKGKLREDSLYEVVNKIEDTMQDIGHILRIGAPDLVAKIEDGKINVFDFSEIDENIADAIASNILKHSLEERKKAVRSGAITSSKLKNPVLFVVEEAHILAGVNKNTESKYYMTKIAREGRKFGIGLCIVTQRPKGLDKEILSQMNNMIILKLVEPEDQKHVQSASESLSKELMSYLPALNPGEAIIIGNMTKIPLLIKIDKAKGKIQGNDLAVVDLWEKSVEKKSNLEDLDQV